MLDEEPIPGITEPNYDEHAGDTYDPPSSTFDPDDIPF